MPTAERRICVYCDTWSQGGIETFLTETLTHMDLSGLSLRLLCAEKQPSRLDERLAAKGLRVEPLLHVSGASALKKTLRCVFPLARLCKKEAIDVVHLNVFQGVSFLQSLVLKLYGVKRVIVHAHGAGLRRSRGQAVKYLGHGLCRALFSWTADERWAASAAAGRFLFGHKPVRIIPNGIDMARFRFDPHTRAALRGDLRVADRLLLGCVGRMDAQKNQRFALSLLRALKDRGIPAALLLIGDGEDRQALGALTAELGLETDVIFLGTSERVNDWMCAMDVLLVPSTSEGLSITAVEGQASGLPVLCSTGVPEEVGLSEAARFLPLAQPEQWLAAIQALPTYDRAALNDRLRQGPYEIERSSALVGTLYRAL